MEIIDRPLSDYIKEQKIDKELRQRRRGGGPHRAGSGGNGGAAAQRQQPERRGDGGRRDSRRRGRRVADQRQQTRQRQVRGRGTTSGSQTNALGRFGMSRHLRHRRHRGGGGSSDAHTTVSDVRSGATRSRRGAVDYGDARRQHGVKSYNEHRPLRTSDADRNERERARRRRSALHRSREARN